MSDQPAKQNRATDLVWDDDTVARLRELWTGGEHSATQIAQDLSDRLQRRVTRNMVLGKLNRLGLKRPEAGKPAPPAPPPPAAAKSEPEPRVMALPFAPPASAPASEPEASSLPGIPLVDIGPFRCRWIVSPDRAPTRFCGVPFDPSNTYSWCEAHRAIGTDVRTPSQVRRDRERMMAARAGQARVA